MFLKRKNIVILIILIALSQNIFAQNTAPIYRCGNSYSQKPCEGGRTIDTTPLIENHDVPQRPSSPRRATSHDWQPDDDHDAYFTQQKNRERQRKERQNQQAQQKTCAHLADELRQLQAEGRRGGSGATMDRLRQRQHNLWDEQRRHGCR